MANSQSAAVEQFSRAELIAALGGLKMHSERRGDVHTIALSGELDLVTHRDVERELRLVEETDAAIVLDLSGVSFIDSSGIRMLLLARARTRDDGARLTFRRPPARVFEVLQVCGIDRMLAFVE